MIPNLRLLATRLRDEPNKTRFLLSRLLWATRLGILIVFVRNGVKYRFWPTSATAQYWKDGNLKSFNWPILKELNLSRKVVVDVGANVGTFSLQVAMATRDTTEVLAIEAHPVIASFLRKNILLNRFENIRVVSKAIGADKRKVLLSNLRGDDMNYVTLSDHNSIEIEQITLDELTIAYEEIYLLKIDVEGGEYQVLRGAKDTLRKTRYLLVEYCPRAYQRSGFALLQVIQILETNGFNIINKDDLEDFNQRSLYDFGHFIDIIAIKI